MAMDIFKSMGYQVHVVARTSKQAVSTTKLEINDPKTMKPKLIQATVKTECKMAHHSLKQLRKYQPLRYLSPNDVSLHSIPVVYWQGKFLNPWPEKVVDMIQDADYVFSDTEMYIRIASELDISHKHIQYVHFPTEGLMPVFMNEPKMIWANSTFTRSWIRIRWGYGNPNYTRVGRKYATVTIPRQIFEADVVHPPLYTEDYRNNNGFQDRPYDVVMFARLGEDKFTVAGFLNKHFKLLTMGALSPIKHPPERSFQVTKTSPRQKQGKTSGFKPTKVFKPTGELHATVTFKEATKLLQQAKVYVHGKGFGIIPETGGQSLPEHFGITICEAMASGCPAIVPRSGGCWTDISMQGKHTLAYSSLEELKATIEVLTSNKEQWLKWHKLALERVKAFDAEKLKPRIKQLLN